MADGGYGFFEKDDISDQSDIEYNQRFGCGRCKLFKGCLSPRMEPTGKGKKGILIIAEAPGKNEDFRGKQLVGKVGQRFRGKLKKLGIDLDRDCIKTNAVRCRPPKNRNPSVQEVTLCRSHILELMKEFQPRLTILLGTQAVMSVIGYRWKKKLYGITRWRGYTIPDQYYKTWICPTFHPSYFLRSRD
jgi:DNA polymerase